MPSILVNLDARLLKELDQVAPPGQRRRAGFILEAVRDAIRRVEYERMNEAYRRQPDREPIADEWSNLEAWKP